MTNPYKILGISPDATDIEVKNAYRALARKYHPDSFAGDEAATELANEKMQELNEAYEQIMQERKAGKKGSSTGGNASYVEIRNMINARRMREAEAALARIPTAERTADWHFLESLILMHRGFVNDAMRELEVACMMDPGNVEYQQAKQMFNQTATGYGRNYYGSYSTRPQGGGCTGCDVCQGLICADCCCECMGGDLISCC